MHASASSNTFEDAGRADAPQHASGPVMEHIIARRGGSPHAWRPPQPDAKPSDGLPTPAPALSIASQFAQPPWASASGAPSAPHASNAPGTGAAAPYISREPTKAAEPGTQQTQQPGPSSAGAAGGAAGSTPAGSAAAGSPSKVAAAFAGARSPPFALAPAAPLICGPARTPSPVLADEPDGHLSFPPVAGLDLFEREMQTLINADDIENPVRPEGLAEIYEKLEKLGISSETLEKESREPHDAHLGVVADLVRSVQQHEEASEQLRHHVRVTRLAALSMLSSLRVSYSHMLQAERDIKARLEVELSGSKSQSRMLSDMVSRASLQSDDMDDPTTSPIVSERNKLLSDRRFLKQRVRDAESQVARLEGELRALRPLLLRQQPDEDETPVQSPTSRRRDVVMGDAKAEHLILAARMLRTLRHRTAGESPKTPRKETFSSPDGPITPHQNYPATPQSVRTRPQLQRLEEWRMPSSQSPFSNGIDELLHAAQSLTGDEVQSPTKRSHRDWSGPSSAPVLGSPKRQRIARMEVDSSESSDRQSTSPTRSAPVSALDLLADQASEVQPAPGPSSAPVSSPAPSKNSPEKRLPYVRWSAEEDVKLRNAIKEHGQRWEFVARAVGTRSYHQCRQRYLLIRRKEAAANGHASPSRANPSPRAPPHSQSMNASSSDEEPATPGRPMSSHVSLVTPPRIPQYMPGALQSPSVPGASPGRPNAPPSRPFAHTRASPAIYS
ncbi:hypothetical protein MCUN1_001828 [Malassezia cuniculi]|uniref:Uncharacterized protein n=1 Tax=Malassezia cuniculi TaxID=948313 RepID=A0AAF0EUR9_9BASI|nr:hypothetical protein MCUN1_001828 [Malassezia cuniculi]